MTEPALQRQLPCWLDGFFEFTAARPSPEIYRKWAGVAAVAGALERRCWIDTNAGRLFPNMFLLFVGAPGVGKDQVIIPVRKLWTKAKCFKVAPVSMSHKGMIDQLADDSSRKQVTDKYTGKIQFYHTLLAAVAELGVILPAHDLAYLSLLNELFHCYEVFQERIRGTGQLLHIDRPHLHLVCGSQPMFIEQLFPEAAFGMGFTARMMMIYAPSPVRASLFGAEKDQAELEETLVEDLRIIEKLQGAFQFTPEAEAMVDEWHLKGAEKTAPTHSKLQHYSARRILQLMKIMMAVSAARSDKMIITAEDFGRSLDLMLEAESFMPEIFKEMASGGQLGHLEEAFHFIMEIWLRTKKPTPEHKLVHFLSNRVPANQIAYLIDTMLNSNMIEDKVEGGLNIPASMRTRAFKPLGLNTPE